MISRRRTGTDDPTAGPYRPGAVAAPEVALVSSGSHGLACPNTSGQWVVREISRREGRRDSKYSWFFAVKHTFFKTLGMQGGLFLPKGCQLASNLELKMTDQQTVTVHDALGPNTYRKTSLSTPT